MGVKDKEEGASEYWSQMVREVKARLSAAQRGFCSNHVDNFCFLLFIDIEPTKFLTVTTALLFMSDIWKHSDLNMKQTTKAPGHDLWLHGGWRHAVALSPETQKPLVKKWNLVAPQGRCDASRGQCGPQHT